jgi:hypothetical protein
MRDWGGAPGMQHTLLAEILGLAMARRAADILDRHRAARAGDARDPVGAPDALLQLIQLAQVARHAAEPGQHG